MTPQTTNMFMNLGIRIDIKEYENFLKIKETLTRIGVENVEKTKLFQSCHILHKRDLNGQSHYAIVHFKEMFILDNRRSSIDDVDLARRNRIVLLLKEWKLLEPLDDIDENLIAKIETMRVIPHRDKHNWELVPKYTFERDK